MHAQLTGLGLPTGLEFRDTITPQFFADLLSYASVSAGSETLQDLVSGLSMPVGLRAPRQDGAKVGDGSASEDLDAATAAGSSAVAR